MRRYSVPEGLDLAREEQLTSEELSTDRSTIMSPPSSLASPPTVNPEPAYIAASAAAQIVTSERQSHAREWLEDGKPQLADETAMVSPASLNLVNAFLDQLLFNFLCCARATSLASLRPAISEVLKPRLAKEAIAGADEELQEFLGGGDDEELLAFHNGQESSTDWNSDLVWKRTRLRCMVYTRLGDMEEEDEDMYIEQENLEDSNNGPRRLSRDLGIVSPAVAIFLTSIIEFIGEHALMVAGEAAYKRVESSKLKDDVRAPLPSNLSSRVVVEEMDMEKVAFNTTLGRLWRSWRKRIRSPRASISRTMSRGSVRRMSSLSSNGNSRKNSNAALDETRQVPGEPDRPSLDQVLDKAEPASIPLPSTAHDVAEIEVPGYSPGAVTRNGGSTRRGAQDRPYSMLFFPASLYKSHTPVPSPPDTPEETEKSIEVPIRPLRRTKRSNSLPTPMQSPFVTAPDMASDQSTFVTPLEAPQPMSFLGQRADGLEEEATPRAEETREPSYAEVDQRTDEAQSFLPSNDHTIGSTTSAVPRIETAQAVLARGIDQDEPASNNHVVTNGVPSDKDHGDLTRYSTSSSADTFSLDQPQQIQRKPSYDPYAPDVYREAPLTQADEHKSGTKKAKVPDVVQTYIDSQHSIPPRNDSIDPSTKQGRNERATTERAGEFQEALPQTQQYQSNLEPSTASRKELQSDGSASRARPPRSDNGAPPLAPLREMLEAAPDTSDEASSPTPSNDARGLEPIRRASPSSAHSQIPSGPSETKVSELRNQLPPVQTEPGLERAAVQRIAPSPTTARESGEPLGRRSTSSHHEVRQIYTSGSGHSQGALKSKGFGGYGDKESIPPRASSDISSGSNSRITVKTDDKLRSFEQLIKSDETVHYTLTPQNMREMESVDSKRYHQPDAAELDSPSGMATPPRLSNDAQAATPSMKAPNGLRSNPAVNQQAQSAPNAATAVGRTASKKGTQPLARDARIEKETTRDFADFIRSTGPEQTPNTQSKNVNGRPGSSARPNTTDSAVRRTASTSQASNAARASGRTFSGIGPVGAREAPAPRTTQNGNGKGRLQAREATTSGKDGSSDLIDFIRQGPPPDRSNGSHRISRTVAPFRTTMDSDEIHALGHGKPKDRNSIISTQESSIQTKSMRSSTNSRTGLLEKPNVSNKTTSYGSPSPNKRPSRNEEPPHSLRKHRKPRDPYAIDTDSEEDDLARPAKAPAQQEESLVDFLRSVAPPQQTAKIEPRTVSNGTSFSNGKTVQRKPSAPSMRARFTRSSSSTSTGAKIVKSPPQSPAGQPRGRGRADMSYMSSMNVRDTSPHLSQTGTKYDSLRPTQPTYASHLDRQRNPKKPLQARSERDNSATSQELADFFKNSAPPPPTSAPRQPAPEPIKEDSTGFSKMFSRRKR